MRDEGYPRNAVTDGSIRLTLWQVRRDEPPVEFDRRTNIGLHHLALQVGSEAELMRLADAVAEHPGTEIEFMPEFMGKGPRKHMMFREPGGIRMELTWSGA